MSPHRASMAPAADPTIGGQRLDPDAPLLDVRDLYVEFRTSAGPVHAVNGLSYHLDAGETLAILGESGSGKTVSAHAILGVLDSPPGVVTGGTARFRGIDLLSLPDRDLRRVRGEHIALIFQDALSALNPVFSVGWQIGEMLRRHRGASRRAARAGALELMKRVRIPNARERLHDYPHEFSGGMRQRVLAAIALALEPEVLIADEPTTALDVTVQAQLMQLFGELQAETGMGLILITHDLGVVAEVADRVTVMYAGQVAEEGDIDTVYGFPAHPYTLGLLRSVPRSDRRREPLQPIGGSPPDMLQLAPGCPFEPRCPFSEPVCVDEDPPLVAAAGGQRSACHFRDRVQREGNR